MGEVSPTLTERWRSARQVGAAKPSIVVRVTRGLIDRQFQGFTALSGGAGPPWGTVVADEEDQVNPWQGFWRSTDTAGPDGVLLPNVFDAKITNGLDQKGRTAVIEVENVVYVPVAGAGGSYHLIERGYLSPGRPSEGGNPWHGVLDEGHKVDVYEGYGDQLSHTFSGLVDEYDAEAKPDRVTITARSFAVLFTDQRIVGTNKTPYRSGSREGMRSPITIADQQRTEGAKPVGHGATASSSIEEHPPSKVTKPGNLDPWISEGHAAAETAPEWLEIKLPEGNYNELYLHALAVGMKAYISIFAKGESQWEGGPIEEGWIPGVGEVDGIPYLAKFTTNSKGAMHGLTGKLYAGEGTILRLTFHNLPVIAGHAEHRAAIYRLAGMELGGPEVARKEALENKFRGWLLIDDVAEAVRRVFLWAGFKEWEAEDLGFSLLRNEKYAAAEFLVAIIEAMVAQADWVFFEKAPNGVLPAVAGEGAPEKAARKEREESLGIPCFVHSSVRDAAPEGIVTITDADLLEAIKLKEDFSNLPYIVRYRGAYSATGEGAEGEGAGTVSRYNAVYFPPWSGAGPKYGTTVGRVAGVRRHDITRDQNLTSDEACYFAAILACIQYALQAFTVEFQISGYPGIELNDQVLVEDATTGLQSRCWVSAIQSEHSTGPNGTWKMTITGALLDSEDMQSLIADLEEARDAWIAPRVVGILDQPLSA